MIEDLDVALRAVADDIRYPQTPDMTGDVMARVRRAPVREPVTSRSRLVFALAAAALIAVALVAAVSLIPSARRAVAGWLGVDGIRITFDDSAPRDPIDNELFLGTPVSADQAAHAVDFDIAIPEELGEPDGYFVMRYVEGGEVSLAWEPGPGLPESEESGLGAVLTQFRGQARPESLKKIGDPGTLITAVAVGDSNGFFIEGEPHLVVRVGNGNERVLAPRLAGNTLIWDDGGVTYRLEAEVSLERAVEIAESMPLQD